MSFISCKHFHILPNILDYITSILNGSFSVYSTDNPPIIDSWNISSTALNPTYFIVKSGSPFIPSGNLPSGTSQALSIKFNSGEVINTIYTLSQTVILQRGTRTISFYACTRASPFNNVSLSTSLAGTVLASNISLSGNGFVQYTYTFDAGSNSEGKYLLSFEFKNTKQSDNSANITLITIT
jgi:hypothetical protein